MQQQPLSLSLSLSLLPHMSQVSRLVGGEIYAPHWRPGPNVTLSHSCPVLVVARQRSPESVRLAPARAPAAHATSFVPPPPPLPVLTRLAQATTVAGHSCVVGLCVPQNYSRAGNAPNTNEGKQSKNETNGRQAGGTFVALLCNVCPGAQTSHLFACSSPDHQSIDLHKRTQICLLAAGFPSLALCAPR